jgi:shikimate 5-dehydrogenase
LFSINFTENIDNSYKINNGIAKPICVIGSGGVSKAAAAKIITTTYFRLSYKN